MNKCCPKLDILVWRWLWFVCHGFWRWLYYHYHPRAIQMKKITNTCYVRIHLPIGLRQLCVITAYLWVEKSNVSLSVRYLWISLTCVCKRKNVRLICAEHQVNGKMSSFSFSTNHINYNQNAQNAEKSASQRRQSQQHQYSPQHSPQPQDHHRRESLVKPTWQNVCPGEVPFDTLEKLNLLSNGEQHSILLQQQVN